MHKSCLGCYYEYHSKCYWFKLKDNSTPKEIPKDVIVKGCSKYYNTSIGLSKSNLQQLLIEKFDGETVGDKYEPPIKQTKEYKRKWVKSPHKYSHRKDAQ